MMRDSQIRLDQSVVLRYNLPVRNAAGEGVWPSASRPAITEGTTGMDVRGVGTAPGVSPLRSHSGVQAPRDLTGGKPVSPQDELEISAAGKMLDKISQTPDLRQERLARIKAEIENGTYDTDEKLEAALSKMFTSLGIDLDADLE